MNFRITRMLFWRHDRVCFFIRMTIEFRVALNLLARQVVVFVGGIRWSFAFRLARRQRYFVSFVHGLQDIFNKCLKKKKYLWRWFEVFVHLKNSVLHFCNTLQGCRRVDSLGVLLSDTGYWFNFSVVVFPRYPFYRWTRWLPVKKALLLIEKALASQSVFKNRLSSELKI